MAAMFFTRTRSLNPEAPEFFPHRYVNLQNNIVANYNHPYLSCPPVVFSATNYQIPPFYYYYFTSGPSLPHPQYYTNTSYLQYPLAVSTQTQMVETQLEPEMEMQHVAVSARVSTESCQKRGECSRNLGSHGREGTHRRHPKKEHLYWRPKSNGNGSDRNCDQRQYPSNRTNLRSCGGANFWQKHQVLPVLPHRHDTTLMIKNIPNRYTREVVMEFLDSHCLVENEKAKLETSETTKETIVSAYDFLYLPIDFERGVNKGYAFVNFTDSRAAWNFFLSTNNQAWDVSQSNKIREITRARLQGKELVSHFNRATFECECENYLPVCFRPARDGSGTMVERRTVGRRIGNRS